MSEIHTEEVIVEVPLEVRVPQGDSYQFDPLNHKLAAGELQSGVDVTVSATRLRDQSDIYTEFSTLHRDGAGVYLDTNELIEAAQEAVRESSQSMPEGDDE